MRRRLRGALAFARTAGVGALVLGAIAVVAAAHLLPIGPVRVPGRPDVRTVVWPLAPVLAALAVPTGAALRFRPWEWVAARPAWQSRALFVALLGVRTVAVVAVAPIERAVIARNLLVFDAVALGVVTIVGRASWSWLLAIPAVCWLVGVEPPGRVRPWALPLLPPDHVGAWVVATVLGTVAVVAYVVVPPRPD